VRKEVRVGPEMVDRLRQERQSLISHMVDEMLILMDF